MGKPHFPANTNEEKKSMRSIYQNTKIQALKVSQVTRTNGRP